MIKNEFNLIREFIRTYFHVDWYLDDPDYEAVWEGYIDELRDAKYSIPLYEETSEFIKLSPNEIHKFLCKEDFCLKSETEAYNWIISFNKFLSEKIRKCDE